jgi:uncharacterized protein DUF2510
VTEAGWYADPEGHGRGRRYWDGSQWTEHYEHPAQAQPAPVQPVQQAPVQQPAQQLPPAGWKDDPEGGPGMRYWDGQQWTDHYHPPRDAATAQQPAAGGFQPASEAFQPSTGSEPAVSTPPAQASTPGSLDETQLDVRGYHGGREESATPAPAESAAAEAPAAAEASGPDMSVDYLSGGEATKCDSCGATIRSTHRFCPACGVKQESAAS